MPTTRQKRERHQRVRVTPAAVELYRQARPLHEGRIACIESDAMCDHAECEEYNRLDRELCAELRVRPWEPSPLDEDSPLHAELEAACA